MKLRVWHTPQIPMQAFYVEVESVEEGVKIMNLISNYDLFQYKQNVRPEYINMNGLEMYDDTLTKQDLIDMDLEDKWISWYVETEDGYFEDPEEYLTAKQQKRYLTEEDM